MEIVISHNKIYVKNAILGESFDGVITDLIVKKDGRVYAIGSKPYFYTDLDRLSVETLRAISEIIETENEDILIKLKKRIKTTMSSLKKKELSAA